MSKKSKSDLLVRVRYLNPLPPPPLAPKLLTISTDINRLGEPSYLSHLAASTPLPMLVDSEMGMPLDLNEYSGVWDGNDEALNTIPDAGRVTHPLDMALLAPLRSLATKNGDEKPPTVQEVSWMRNANYITRKNNTRRRELGDASAQADADVDASEEAQVLAIESSFFKVHEIDVKTLRHPDPSKRDLNVVETYDVLPDDENWGNTSIMIRFPERPTTTTALSTNKEATSEQLSRGILQECIEDGLTMFEYYLPRVDDVQNLATAYEKPISAVAEAQLAELARENMSDPKIDEIYPHALYERIRTYEVVSKMAPQRELLLSICEEDEPARKRKKGAYLKEIAVKTVLRKRGTKRRGDMETRENVWDKVRVGYKIPDEAHAQTQGSASSMVKDEHWTNDEIRRLEGGDDMAVGLGEAIDDEEDDM